MDKSFLAIDKHNLDQEWLGQPLLYMEYAEKLAEARRQYDNASSAANAVYAELSRKIRSDPDDYGFDTKPTEAAISAKIEGMGKFKKASRLKADAKYEVDLYQAAVIALEHRKRALTELVELHMSNYFSEPRAKKSEFSDKVSDSLQDRMSKRTSGKFKKRKQREDR